MSESKDIIDAIERAIGNNRSFSLREVIMLGSIVVGVAGAWYTTQNRMDSFEEFTRSFSAQVKDNSHAINAHLQWELQHEIEQKQDIINQLRRGVK